VTGDSRCGFACCVTVVASPVHQEEQVNDPDFQLRFCCDRISRTFDCPNPASAALEGVRDCGDDTSKAWVHVLEGSPNDLVYLGNDWFVFAGVGMKPRCNFARK